MIDEGNGPVDDLEDAPLLGRALDQANAVALEVGELPRGQRT